MAVVPLELCKAMACLRVPSLLSPLSLDMLLPALPPTSETCPNSSIMPALCVFTLPFIHKNKKAGNINLRLYCL